jgi:hypothetical protein
MRAIGLVLLTCACHEHATSKEKHEPPSGGHANEPAVAVPEEESPAHKALSAYVNATTCEDRRKTIMYPEHNTLTACAPVAGLTSVYTKKCDEIDAGTPMCKGVIHTGNRSWDAYLVQQPNGFFLVDHRATEADRRDREGNDLSSFVKRKPTQVEVVRAAMSIDRMPTHFAPGFTLDTHYLVRLHDGTVGLDAYLPKTSPDAPLLEAAIRVERLKGVVAMRFPNKASHDALIVRVFATNYLETPAEDEFLANAGDAGR